MFDDKFKPIKFPGLYIYILCDLKNVLKKCALKLRCALKNVQISNEKDLDTVRKF